MTSFRIALANLRFPDGPAQSVRMATEATTRAASAGAKIVCFPECFVPGYRSIAKAIAPADAEFLEQAWNAVADTARESRIAVVLGTERVINGSVVPTALVINERGERDGFQDKVQLDPSEEGPYAPGHERRIFRSGPLVFGVVICHEGWRYPETVRWAARRGAQIVFHPQFHEAEPGAFRPKAYGDPANSFHESAVRCRAAENTCYFATANYASDGSPTTSAIARPDGTLLAYQPYGEEGLLVADIDLAAATGLLAMRYKPTC
jgi:predicted amidohydrolase